ncbi:hypothetical protein FRC08_016728 [Ceratobasidium sp. 394]|nr:hypothetical protein FRC08_016728 [Ceratobasidium sp. 394]
MPFLPTTTASPRLTHGPHGLGLTWRPQLSDASDEAPAAGAGPDDVFGGGDDVANEIRPSRQTQRSRSQPPRARPSVR